MKDLSIEQWPPLTYQLLVLSSKGYKDVVVRAIVCAMSEREDQIMLAQHRC